MYLRQPCPYTCESDEERWRYTAEIRQRELELIADCPHFNIYTDAQVYASQDRDNWCVFTRPNCIIDEMKPLSGPIPGVRVPKYIGSNDDVGLGVYELSNTTPPTSTAARARAGGRRQAARARAFIH